MTFLINDFQSSIIEPERKIPVCAEADVIVVGGGPAGVAAAVSAARNQCKTILIERYGHLGGMATGGLVILIPHLSDGSKQVQIQGINQEWLDRLDKQGGALHPPSDAIGSTDVKTLNKWSLYFACVVSGRIRQSVYVEPEILKCVMSDMVNESGVQLALHSWGARAWMKDGRVAGVVFESKSGRMAVAGKMVIDCTGDGDIFASAGAEYEMECGPDIRSSMMALVFRLGNTDFLEFARWRDANPEAWKTKMQEMNQLAGFKVLPLPSARNDVVWINNWLPGGNCLDINDLTNVETKVRQVMPVLHHYMKQNIPGFGNCFIFDTAAQLGTRGSRRLKGLRRLTMADFKAAKTYQDTVAVFPSIFPDKIGSVIHFPYRAMVPETVNGVIAAGRCFSSSLQANDMINLIPHCAAMGEAAGCAAAIALQSGVEARDVDVRKVRSTLIQQGVYLPE
jgi:hypothetical protein